MNKNFDVSKNNESILSTGSTLSDFLNNNEFKPQKYGQVIPVQEVEDKKQWQIESTDRYYFLSSRNSKQYQEVTFWYNPYTFERKETTRIEYCSDGQEYKLSEWCKSCQYRKSLNY